MVCSGGIWPCDGGTTNIGWRNKCVLWWNLALWQWNRKYWVAEQWCAVVESGLVAAEPQILGGGTILSAHPVYLYILLKSKRDGVGRGSLGDRVGVGGLGSSIVWQVMLQMGWGMAGALPKNTTAKEGAEEAPPASKRKKSTRVYSDLEPKYIRPKTLLGCNTVQHMQH